MGETRMNPCIRPWREDDSGQTTILVVGLSAICILLATVILAATAVNIEARRLLSLADGASAAAADSFTLDVGEDPEGSAPVLTQERAAATVQQYLESAAASSRFEGLRVQEVRVGDQGQTVDVVLTATARPPIANIVVPDGVTVLATSSSRTALTR